MRRLIESPRTRNFLRRVLPRPVIESLKNIRGVSQRMQQAYREEGHLRNRRFAAIEEIAGYLVGADLTGDYLEFGVFEGTTFSYATRELGTHFPDMSFYAFDSFEGLPAPEGIDNESGYASDFHEGQFACSEKHFLKRLGKDGCPISRVKTIPGFFDQSLVSERVQQLDLQQVAVAWIDCDLYASTVPVLDYLTDKLTCGSVLAFDDWRCYRNLPDYGEQRACREWLEANPQIELHELFSFGWHGLAFTVNIRETQAETRPMSGRLAG